MTDAHALSMSDRLDARAIMLGIIDKIIESDEVARAADYLRDRLFNESPPKRDEGTYNIPHVTASAPSEENSTPPELEPVRARLHILKEDKEFFLPSMSYFSDKEQAIMLEEFERFDMAMIHWKYQQVIKTLTGKTVPIRLEP
jgi:hypothetical protein